MATLDKHDPLCEHTIPPRLHAPWITPEVTEAKAERRISKRQWKKTGLTVHKDIYRARRSNCVQLMRERKKDHVLTVNVAHSSQTDIKVQLQHKTNLKKD
ncbi:hypothetical protein ElyMa_004627700 [Elysia marginata]|uniref:Uncharacterized protein n=1 Tax=Elysia marginata TaxID=1093978 RepID=A0AAV4I3L3_9GAST|nr:hypothetical protein ElyMa_004627700 [Elysia marginata]